MCEKVKVNSQIAVALEGALDEYDGDKNLILQNHKYDWMEECIPLNNLTHLEFAEILIKGYEVEKTPAELLEDYEKYNTNEQMYNDSFKIGVQKTIKFFKENFEIKGINDND